MLTNSILTIKEVSEVLRISPALAYRLVSEGHLTGIRFGRTVRVKSSDLDSFIAGNLTSNNYGVIYNGQIPNLKGG